jgi:HEAT repeat protein
MAKFVKGQSGNPGGRPKDAVHVRELARQYTEQAIAVLVDALESDRPDIRVKAAEALLDRGFGKPTQSLEHSGADGAPLGIAVKFL